MKRSRKLALLLVLTMLAAMLPLSGTTENMGAGANSTVSSLAGAAVVVTPPAISISGTVVSWDAVPGAERYDIFVNGEWTEWGWPDSPVDLRWIISTLSTLPNRTLQVQVASGKYVDGYWQSSALSNSVNVTAAVIPAPTEISVEGHTLSWRNTDATNKGIYLNGERIGFISTWLVGSGNLQTFDLAGLDLGTGNHRFQVRAICGSAFGWSNLSVEATLTIGNLPRLSPPNVTRSENIISWNRIVGAVRYEVVAERQFEGEWTTWNRTTTAETSFDLRALWIEEGVSYRIRVRAIGNLETHLNSNWSTAITFTPDGGELPRLATPVITLSGSVISWNAVPNAIEYWIFINGDWHWTLEAAARSFDLRLLGLPTDTPVQAQIVAAGGWHRFRESELSNAVTFTPDGTSPQQLATPVISINGAIVSWDAVPNAQRYSLWWQPVGGFWHYTRQVWVEGTSFDMRMIDTLTVGASYVITVGASCGVRFINSEFSIFTPYTHIAGTPDRIPAPSITINNGVISWARVDAALEYYIYINGSREVGIIGTLTSFDLRNINLANGTYTIRLRAMNGERYLDSNLSNTVTLILPVPVVGGGDDGGVGGGGTTISFPAGSWWWWNAMAQGGGGGGDRDHNRGRDTTPFTYSGAQLAARPALLDAPPPGGPVITGATMLFQIGSLYALSSGVTSILDAPPFIDPATDRTMVPLRAVAEGLGATVEWHDATRTVEIWRLDVGMFLSVDGPLPGGMGVPMIVNDRTFVPLRYVSEMLGASVRWDDGSRTVYVY